MRFTTLLLAIFPAALMASPVETNARDVAARDFPGVAVRMWSGDVCDGEVEPVNIVGHGAYRCVAVTNKRSIVKITERPLVSHQLLFIQAETNVMRTVAAR
jgi:hypothetical protein